MFDPEEMVPWSRIPVDTVACVAHRDVSLEMARKSIVLLKNANGVLPMNRDMKKIAVIGPNAHFVDVQYGNYNGTPVAPVSVLDGIRTAAGDAAEVRFAVGSPHHAGMPYLSMVPEKVLFRDREGNEPGLNVGYYPNLGCEGEPLQTGVVPTVDFYGWDGEPPVVKLTDDNYSVEWSGFLLPDRSGIHSIGVEGKYVRLILDGDTLINHQNIHHPNKIYRKLELAAGKPYGIRIMMSDRQGDASCRLHWEEPGLPLLWEAVQVAQWADHVILVMGLTPWLEGEEMRGLQLEGFSKGDRTSLDLPEIQRRLIRRIAATGRPVTLVLMSGSALSINWENDHLPAILQAWYGGEAAGTAVAEVLFGNYNPAGRLPVTFYHSVDDLPDFEDYSMKGRTYRYFEGEVLYPFGYGLSYTTFSYDNLILEQDEISAGESLSVSVDVTNTGRRDGEEVVQLYIRDLESEEARPHKELKGFRRVSIKSGQTLTVAMTLHADDMVTYDVSTGDYIVEPGLFEIMVGPSSDSSVQLIKELLVR
jgi:beta-glucosidase